MKRGRSPADSAAHGNEDNASHNVGPWYHESLSEGRTRPAPTMATFTRLI
jgi:hypothetical protein